MTSTDARPAPPEEDEINIMEIVVASWAGKKKVALAMAVGLLSGLFFVLRTEPISQAHGLLQ